MVRAYGFAMKREPKPFELDLNERIGRWGVEAVFGKRILTVREMRDLDTAEAASTMLHWFNQRAIADNWATWEQANSQKAEFLNLLHEDYLEWQITRSK